MNELHFEIIIIKEGGRLGVICIMPICRAAIHVGAELGNKRHTSKKKKKKNK